MSTPEISDLIALANEKVLTKIGKPLSEVQISILQQILEEKKLKDVHVSGYGDATIQQMTAPKLWALLTEATEKSVRKNTVRLVLENLWNNQPSDQKNPHDKPSPENIYLPPIPPSSPQARHNLPANSCTEFIGREEEIARILKLLAPTHGARIISIDGIGGVGKTTLAVEAAYRCLNASNDPDEESLGIPTFEAIIFTSAKQHILAPFGLVNRLNPKRTLRDILRQIAKTLGNVDLTGKTFEDKLDCLQDALSLQRTLLIVDNLETIEDPQDVLSFLYDLPPSVKAMITTRKQIIFVPLRLSSLPEFDGLRLIQHEAQEKEVILSEAEQQELYQKTGGVPVAINYAIGQVASGRAVQQVLHDLANAAGDVARFLFESSVAPLREQAALAYQLLMGLTFFSTPVRRETLIEVALTNGEEYGAAESSQDEARAALAGLQELSLVRQEQDRYTMLPLTREYAIAELKTQPTFEKAARERWIRWGLGFVEQYGQQEIWDWRQQNDVIEAEWSNLQTLIEWCVLKDRYDELYQLWQGLEAHIHLQGNRSKRSICWGDRLDYWIKWLIETAKQKKQLAVAAVVMVSRGWLLTTMGQAEHLDVADQLFTDAWTTLRHHQTPAFQLGLAVDIAALRIRQDRLGEAQTWLDQAMELLEDDQVTDSERLSQLSRLEYYRGKVYFAEGEYEPAKAHFTEALAAARAVGWQLGVQRISNWLADAAIKQGEFRVAEPLLLDNFQVAEANQDIYQMAFCQRSLANLAVARDDRRAATEWARKGLEHFSSLDMLAEAEEAAAFLQGLEVEFTELRD
jgi:tetratricopeptide (TPR) repeat protein